ncbi:MAG: histidine kinase [Thiohalocapsa sp.]|nr:histidine kinase [Thiohalocapsa sp.]MCF7989262.1 histidine kinase [Thiohalocapsa sp.]
MSPAIAVSPPREADTGFSALLPGFCRPSVVFGAILFGELLAVIVVLASPYPLSLSWPRFGLLSLLIVAIASGSAAVLCLLRHWLARRKGRVLVLSAWLLVVGTSLLVTAAGVWLLNGSHADLLPDGAASLSIRVGLISAIVAALMLRYLYLHHQWRAQVEAVANARYQTLQARIRPHFLFNSMNTIASLTQTDPRMAEEVVEDLADLFRASLATDSTETTLAQELELARRYLNIESHRLGDRMRVRWEMSEVPGDAVVPPLILQPLMENAVYHGIQPSAQGGDIHIAGCRRNGYVEVGIRNSLPAPSDTSGGARRGNHIALQNVSQRMDAMFNGAASVTQSRVDGDYLVTLAFPYPWRLS